MDIFLSTKDRKQVIQLPIVPAELKIQDTVNNETFTTVNQGDIKLLGLRGLKSISFDSFFFHDTQKQKGLQEIEQKNKFLFSHFSSLQILTCRLS